MKRSCTQAPTAIITGAAKRIGAAIAQKLHHEGWRVVIHYHQSKAEAESLSVSLNKIRPDSAYTIQADLTVKEHLSEVIEKTLNWANQLDALVNNASIFKPTHDHSLEENDWEALFATNVKAPFWLSYYAFPHLKISNGSIINITDIHGSKPLKGYAIYCQTKAALSMQTCALAREFAPDVRVNAIAPGAIAWPEHENELTEAEKKQIIEKTPLKKHGHPDYIAQAVFSIIENPFITGVSVPVDGGRSII